MPCINLVYRSVTNLNVIMSANNLESRLIQAYTWLVVAPKQIGRARTASLERHGFYEVRLVEPLETRTTEAVPFWIELFDHQTQTSLDSFGSVDLEDVARAADELISLAKSLHQGLC